MTVVISTPGSATTQEERAAFWFEMSELVRRIRNERIQAVPPILHGMFRVAFAQNWNIPISGQAAHEYQILVTGKTDEWVEIYDNFTLPNLLTFPDSKYASLILDIEANWDDGVTVVP